MKTLKQPFILFFVAGMVPTPKELAEAGKLRARVGYRNASVVQDGEPAEPCDGVAGQVPSSYAKFPRAEAAIAAYDKKLDDAAKAADGAVGKPPTERKPGPGAGSAPQGFENLPGGDGAVGAPAAAGAAPAGDSKPADEGQTNAPAGDATAKPPAWGSGPKPGKK